MELKVIAFDADDTLWDCQSHFEAVEKQLYGLIAPYCDDPAKELFKTESGNMADLGYGCKAFTISIIETALRVGGSHLTAEQLTDLLAVSKALLHLPATPLPGVEQTLKTLRERGDWRMVCFTKGELQDQENKLKRSGLLSFFDDVEITSDKGQKEFVALCEHQHIHPLLPDTTDNTSITGRKKPVITVNKLYIFPNGPLYSTVTRYRRPLVPHIMLHQYLTLLRRQIQCLDATYTIVQHPARLVVIRYNEGNQHRHCFTENFRTPAAADPWA